ncbi:MAG: RNA polymerase sigma factor, partial [Candidatus Saccharimonadales bacterium]|nr:RNA polymerase sigma factor [Candidatus Saccharimonadales bacterium]
EDETLVTAVIEENQELYAHIVHRYQTKLTRYARSIVYDEDMAADAVQTAFIKAFENLRGFNTKLKFSSWIYRITHNESINLIRKAKKELRPDDETWFDNIADERETADLELDKEFQKQEIADALSYLEVRYREPLVLHIFEGQSYKEIGDILKLPTATVGTRISRAKQQLKIILTKKGDQS